MRQESVSVEGIIEASAEIAWRLLTIERDAWWPDLIFEAAVDAPLIETWIEEGEQRTARGVITRCEPHALLAFRWSDAESEAPLEVVIRLENNGLSTTVTITETGFADVRHRPEAAKEHEDGWRYHLARWKHAAEVGPASTDVE